jgi:hypothetical protein
VVNLFILGAVSLFLILERILVQNMILLPQYCFVISAG